MRILGTGRYLPENTLSNEDLSKFVDTNDEWIVSRTGIKSRSVATDENTSDLAIKAAKLALENADVKASDIQLIVVATSTPETFLPGVSHQVLKAIQTHKAMAFDLNAACTGFVYGMDVAMSLMRIHDFRYALVIGSEVLSKIIDWDDRNTCVLFGDGAGAVVLEYVPDKVQLLYSRCIAIPDVDDVLCTNEIVVHNPLNQSVQSPVYLNMKGQDVFKFAVRVVCESVNEALSETGLRIHEIDYFILHQANHRIIDYAAKKLGVSTEKFYSTIEATGNTSAASIPIVLDKMNEENLLNKGMKLALVGFGAGLTYGIMLMEW